MKAERKSLSDNTLNAGAAAGSRPARSGGAAARTAPAELEHVGLPEAAYRAVIAEVRPQVDGGRHPAKRTRGESVEIFADVIVDGHDVARATLLHRAAGEHAWTESAMEARPNDLFRGVFVPNQLGVFEYRVRAWVDRFAGWQRDLAKRVEAGQDVASELLEGAALVREAAARALPDSRDWLDARATELTGARAQAERVRLALDPALETAVSRWPDPALVVTYDRTLRLQVDRPRARFGAWYEFFPRSAGRDPQGATLPEAAARLPAIAAMGFDVVYLPPIHPIGRTHRKGPNNTLRAGPDDPGSPWAIGGAEGGHTAIHPALGTFDDFAFFVETARAHALEVALDLAYQCSPDHPWVREHPEWFRHRPDGSIKYAENPPKRYQDIYPIDFECADWRGLWRALADVVHFWVARDVRIFRVDNPHTKPFRFWAWLIADVQRKHPEVIFLAEAFTRPKVMKHLAKIGFTQSYTYFTWRNTRPELTEYFTELTRTEVREYLRPNLFANTPDILHEYLQVGRRPAFQIRHVLAATLGATYGIYGPGFELCDAHAVPGTEEYHDSEKYQIRDWDLDAPGHIRDFITRVNTTRRENPALHYDHTLRFHDVDNPQLLFYSKASPDRTNVVCVIVNLDPHHVQDGWVTVPLHEFGIGADEAFQVHDTLSDSRFLWRGERNYVRLDPHACPAHLLVVRRKVKTERDFDYYQ